jgi:hypothetical protein
MRLIANATANGWTDKSGGEPGQGSGGVEGQCDRLDEEDQSDPDSDANEPTESGQDDGFDEDPLTQATRTMRRGDR